MNITIDGCNCGCSAGPGAGQDKGRGDVLRSSSVVELFNVDINEHQFTQYSELQSPKNHGKPNPPTSNDRVRISQVRQRLVSSCQVLLVSS